MGRWPERLTHRRYQLATSDPAPGTANPGQQPTPTYSLMASQVGIKDLGGYFDAGGILYHNGTSYVRLAKGTPTVKY